MADDKKERKLITYKALGTGIDSQGTKRKAGDIFACKEMAKADWFEEYTPPKKSSKKADAAPEGDKE